MKWDGITLKEIVKSELYDRFSRYSNAIRKASEMNNTEYAAFLKKKYNYSGGSGFNDGVCINCGSNGIEITLTQYFDKSGLEALEGENKIELSWSMAARHIRAWELEKEQDRIKAEHEEKKFGINEKSTDEPVSSSAKEQWECTHLCGGSVYFEGHCEHLLEPTEDTVINGKKVTKYDIYCTSENKVRKIGTGGLWTGLSPKFCPKRKALEQNNREPTEADIILFKQYKEEFGRFCRFDKVMGSDSIYAKQHWDKAQKIYDKIVSQGLEPAYKKWREMNRENFEQQKTMCDSCINKDENCLIPSENGCIGYTSVNDKVFSIANHKKEDKMAKKRSFDTAILKDIKSVAGDSFADNIKMLPVDQLHDNPENFYDLSDLDTLVEDIDRQGLKTPLYVVPDDDGYMVISGHRRKAAVQELIVSGKYGTDKLPCYIGAKKNEAEAMLDLIMLNATTRVISDAEMVKQCEKLEEVFKQLEANGKKVQGRMRDKIAAALNVSPAQVGKVENIRHNAIDEVKVAVDEGKMSISTANEVAKLEPKKQKDLIEKKKPEEITHKEIKNTVSAAKEKTSPKQQAEKIIERLEHNDDVSMDEINQIPEADLDYEDGFEDMTLDEYDSNSDSDDKVLIMPTAEEDAEMREKATTAAKAMKELWVKPPEYFNNIVDSGMCNSIISGYVLLILEAMEIERPSNILKIINSVLDFQNAQAARDKFSDN